jgi:26S proteasome regulatory subunit N1
VGGGRRHHDPHYPHILSSTEHPSPGTNLFFRESLFPNMGDEWKEESPGNEMLVESSVAGGAQKDEKATKKNTHKNGKKNPEELSEEDTILKEGLELAVTRLQEGDKSLHKQALDHLVNEIRTSTSSMTSVPKPLKFLLPHYATLKLVYESWAASHEMKRTCADMMSVLAMTMAEKGSFECLKFKLQGTQVNIASWGHEYVRYLSGEISEEYNKRQIEEAELVRVCILLQTK